MSMKRRFAILLASFVVVALLPQTWLADYYQESVRESTTRELDLRLEPPTAIERINRLQNSTRPRTTKPVVFVHFHKAGGTSLIKMFTRTLRPWRPNKNGNPWGMTDDNKPFAIPFWRYDKTGFDLFLNRQKLMRFLAMEWNFFTSMTKNEVLSSVDLITCIRDPYSRFVSNLYFSGYQASSAISQASPRSTLKLMITISRPSSS